jgi:hypothetical protein
VTVNYDLAIKQWLHEFSLDVKSEIESMLAEMRQFSAKYGAQV